MTYLSKAMLEYLALRMVYKVESRLGIDRNSDQYTVLNWMKSGIESLYIIILTQFIPLFSLFFSYFSIFFFSFQTQWADQFHISAPTPGYFALRKEIIEIDLLVFRTIHVCGSSKFIFANKGKRKERTWSNEVTIHFGNILWNVWETTRFQEIRILFKLSILLYLRRSINFLTKS